MKVGHIGINVNDIQRSKAFYINLFDFEILGECDEKGKKFAFLGKGRELMMTLWEQSDKKFSQSNAGLHHLAFVLKDRGALEQFEEKINRFGVEKIYDRIVSHAEGASSGGIYFYDPDGIRLEVYVTEGLHSCKPATDGAPSCGFF